MAVTLSRAHLRWPNEGARMEDTRRYSQVMVGLWPVPNMNMAI